MRSSAKTQNHILCVGTPMYYTNSTPQSVPIGRYFEPWLHEITVTDSCERLFKHLVPVQTAQAIRSKTKVFPWSGSGYPFERNVIRCKTRLRNSASSTN